MTYARFVNITCEWSYDMIMTFACSVRPWPIGFPNNAIWLFHRYAVLLFLWYEIGPMNVLYVPMIEKLWVLLIYIGVLGNDILISPWYKLRISNTLTLKCFFATTYWTFKLYDCSYDVSVNVPLIWHVDVLFDNISWAFLICMDVSVWHMNIS